MSTEAAIPVEDAVAVVNDVLLNLDPEAEPVTAHTKIEELGLSSIALAEVLVGLEVLAEGELDPESVNEVRVVADFAHLRWLPG